MRRSTNEAVRNTISRFECLRLSVLALLYARAEGTVSFRHACVDWNPHAIDGSILVFIDGDSSPAEVIKRELYRSVDSIEISFCTVATELCCGTPDGGLPSNDLARDRVGQLIESQCEDSAVFLFGGWVSATKETSSTRGEVYFLQAGVLAPVPMPDQSGWAAGLAQSLNSPLQLLHSYGFVSISRSGKITRCVTNSDKNSGLSALMGQIRAALGEAAHVLSGWEMRSLAGITKNKWPSEQALPPNMRIRDGKLQYRSANGIHISVDLADIDSADDE